MKSTKHPIPVKLVELLESERGTAQQLADFFGVHKNRLSRIKRGVAPLPSGWLKHISVFAKSKGVKLSVEDLLTTGD